MENKNHNHTAACPYCPPANSRPLLSKSSKDKLLSFLGVCGCVSCYFAMFPAILLGIVGVLGLSTSATTGALNAYMNSIFFQPILVFSILFLIIGLIRYGNTPLLLSVVSGVGIFVSMNFYMRSWFFTLSFALLALAYFFAYRKLKSAQLKIALILILAVVILGVIDIGRTAFLSPNPQNNAVPRQQTPLSTMRMQ